MRKDSTMIIAIPVDEKEANTKVCISYGRTPFFMLYNTDTKDSQFLDNSAASAAGGAGIKASQSLVDNKVDVVLTMRCGENAAEVLNGQDIKMYKTEFPTAKENIDAFLKNELSLLNDIHPGFHNHG